MSRRTGHVAYLTFDGILDPLGWSQVARVVLGLARRGHRYEIVSLEKRERLGDAEAVEAARTRLDEAGVRWQALPYARGRLAAAMNAARMARELRVQISRGAGLIHARSYPPGATALLGRALAGVPYVLDARGYWIDERAEAGGRIGRGVALAVSRAVEAQLYRRASAVVTLTELHATDVRSGRFGRWTGRPIVAIPTCADYDAFRPRAADAAPPHPLLGSGLVLGLVGSANPSYRTTESLELAAKVLRRRPDAILAVLTTQRELFERLSDRAGIPRERRLVTTVGHDAMPRWVPWLDWCLHLLAETPAKRASMPTKLAELFAAGVRPIHVGCNPEVGGWIERAGSGIVLRDAGEPELERAAAAVAAGRRDAEVLRRAREATWAHFSLERGVERYADLLAALGVA